MLTPEEIQAIKQWAESSNVLVAHRMDIIHLCDELSRLRSERDELREAWKELMLYAQEGECTIPRYAFKKLEAAIMAYADIDLQSGEEER